MPELDLAWSEMLETAIKDATETGRRDVAGYLRLKAANDAVRRAGIEWLFKTLIALSEPAMRTFPKLTVERTEPHNFAAAGSNMVGSRIEIRLGVRCLTAEAGWARTPGDGIMKKQALASARISHFGSPVELLELRLVHTAAMPQWIQADGGSLDEAELQRQIEILIS